MVHSRRRDPACTPPEMAAQQGWGRESHENRA